MAQLRISLLAVAALLCSSPALGGLYEDLYIGLGYLATPSGSPVSSVTGGGQSNGNRYGRLRIVANDYGNGYRLEFDRTFGTDSYGRAETFDLGNLELTLSGSTQMTASYTTRGIPTFNIDAYTSSLSYLLVDETAGQEFELSGTLDVTSQVEINRFGSYEIVLEINNTDATLEGTGLIVDGSTDADFDVGPITVSGNVFVDLAASALSAVGVDTSELESLFPASPIERITEEIEALLGEDVVLSETVTSDLTDDTLSSDSTAAAELVSSLVTVEATDTIDSGTLGVPESSTLLLIGALALIGFRRRA